jgi:hypothetical protein
VLKDRAALLFHLEYLGIPHAATIRELIARYGVRRSRYFDWHEVRIDGARPLVAHQVDPFCFSLATGIEADLLPPSAFHAYASVGSDARENHAATLAVLSPLLGAPRETSASNTIAPSGRSTRRDRGLRVSARAQSRCLEPAERHPARTAHLAAPWTVVYRARRSARVDARRGAHHPFAACRSDAGGPQ